MAELQKSAMSGMEISQIKDYLLNFDLFKGKEQEGINYVNDALQRFLIILELIPKNHQRVKLLELGANPYFMTLLIKKFRNCEIFTANYFGTQHEGLKNSVDMIFNEKHNEKHEFVYKHFNVEKDIFPYEDNEFDIILCCEIIEHLGLNPTHMLYEIHRILKPDGCLIITTPNVSRIKNVQSLLKGKNIYDPYSGYGVYGRHNREYTFEELVYLLRECNYDIIKAFAEDIHVHSFFERVINSINPDTLKDNLFVVAKPIGNPRYRYPPELYRSMYNVLKVSKSYIIMGDNDVTQIGEGWHDLENWPPYIRWTKKKAIAYLKKDTTVNKLLIKAIAHVPLTGSIMINKQQSPSFTIGPSKWQTIETELPELSENEIVEISIEVEKTWIPENGDKRELGIAIQSILLT